MRQTPQIKRNDPDPSINANSTDLITFFFFMPLRIPLFTGWAVLSRPIPDEARVPRSRPAPIYQRPRLKHVPKYSCTHTQRTQRNKSSASRAGCAKAKRDLRSPEALGILEGGCMLMSVFVSLFPPSFSSFGIYVCTSTLFASSPVTVHEHVDVHTSRILLPYTCTC